MALEDLAMFRSVPMSTVFYPSDGVATEKAVELAANTKVSYVAILFETSSSVRETEGGGQAQRVGHWVPREAFPDLIPGVCRT